MMLFFKNPDYLPFFGSVGETFLTIVVIQLVLTIFGYPNCLLDQKGLYVAFGSLVGYLFGYGILYLGNKIFPYNNE
jgi:hypothetical protein